MSGVEEIESEYMLELIECSRCNIPTPRKDLCWNTGSYTDTCERCAKSYEEEIKDFTELIHLPDPVN